MPFENVLSKIRVGDYRNAEPLLREAIAAPEPERVVIAWEGLSAAAQREQLHLVRAATLASEIADYKGDRNGVNAALEPFSRLAEHLKGQRLRPARKFEYRSKGDIRWQLLRAELYCAWQLGVRAYRDGDMIGAKRIIGNASHIAELMRPRSEGLLGQLYYADALLRLRDRDFLGAAQMFRRSLVSASDRFSRAGDNLTERSAAQYCIAKALALGLAQSLLDQGRAEEARTVAVAGRLLLELTGDGFHKFYARQLLGSIERACATDSDAALLASARDHLEACAAFFGQEKPVTAFHARYELGLIDLHLGQLKEAEKRIGAVLRDAREAERPHWIATAHVGLSRVARKAGDYGRAVDEAIKARRIAHDHGLITTEIKARTAQIQALFDQHKSSPDDLKEVEREIRSLLADVPEYDVRSRAVATLVLARVHAATGNRHRARAEFEEYERIRMHMQSARIGEFANVVLDEIFPPKETFRCPADDAHPNFNLKANEEAMRAHVIRKTKMFHKSVKEIADALGLSKSQYHAVMNKLDE